MPFRPLNLLVIGGCPRESDHLLPPQDYIRQFTRRLACPQQVVRVSYFPSVLLPSALSLLKNLPLASYDLILLRPELPTGKLPGWLTLSNRLTNALTALYPYRKRVVALTPFPHRGSWQRVSRYWFRFFWQRIVGRAGYRLFDTRTAIQPREEYFLTNDAARLNAVSHELLGLELAEYCQDLHTIRDAQAGRPSPSTPPPNSDR